MGRRDVDVQLDKFQRLQVAIQENRRPFCGNIFDKTMMLVLRINGGTLRCSLLPCAAAGNVLAGCGGKPAGVPLMRSIIFVFSFGMI